MTTCFQTFLILLVNVGSMIILQYFGGWGDEIWNDSVRTIRSLFATFTLSGGSINNTFHANNDEPWNSGFVSNGVVNICKWSFILATFNSSQFFFLSKGLMITLGFTLMEVVDSYRKGLQLCTSVDDVCNYKDTLNTCFIL